MPPVTDPKLLAHIGSDAAVYKVSDELAVVQTIDYITPVVDDPFLFGQIAAANALSDIYALGATPVYALNLIGFPVRSLPLGTMEAILQGGAAKAGEAGVSIAGGHSIEDHAPKYGMAVTGFVHPDRLVTSSGARPGDVLFLTKPLGSGVITTALDKGLHCDDDLVETVIALMAALNQGAAQAMLAVGVHGATDVTGFGLLGHLHEMALASGVSAVVEADRVPMLRGVLQLAEGAVSNGTRNNVRFLQDHVTWSADVSQAHRIILSDAQTSGGLLIAVSPDRAEALAVALAAQGCLSCHAIGHLEAHTPGAIHVRSNLAQPDASVMENR